MADAPTTEKTSPDLAKKGGLINGLFAAAAGGMIPVPLDFSQKPAATAPSASASTQPVKAPNIFEKLFGDEKDIKTRVLQTAENPAELVINQLSGAQTFKNPAGRKALEDIKNDNAFTTALNAAIKKDSTVAPGLAGKGGAKLDVNAIAEAMKDPDTRDLFTKLLTKVSESDNDNINFAHMMKVSASVQKGDYKTTKALLAEANIQDERVDKAADPIGALVGFARNPDKGIAGWIDDPKNPFSKLDDGSKNKVAGFLKGIVQLFSSLLMPGNGFIDDYMKLFGRIGDKLDASGAKIRGHGIVDAEVGPPRPTAAVPGADNTQTAGATVGDRGNAKVADNQRATAAFNTVSAGTPAQVAQVNAPAANDPIFRQTGTGGPGVGPA